MNIVHNQGFNASKPGPEAALGIGPHCFQKRVRERLGRNLDDVNPREPFPQAVRNALQEMSFSQTHPAVDQQGVKCIPAGFHHFPRCGQGQAVAGPRHKVFKAS